MYYELCNSSQCHSFYYYDYVYLSSHASFDSSSFVFLLCFLICCFVLLVVLMFLLFYDYESSFLLLFIMMSLSHPPRVSSSYYLIFLSFLLLTCVFFLLFLLWLCIVLSSSYDYDEFLLLNCMPETSPSLRPPGPRLLSTFRGDSYTNTSQYYHVDHYALYAWCSNKYKLVRLRGSFG